MNSARRHLVIGASGFLGSHVARRLAESGVQVRALVRRSSLTRGIEDLDVDVRHGDIHDADSIHAAMDGADVVHHCAVDTRPWLRDPAPLYATNVDGLRTVLDVAREHRLDKFVLTSTVATLPIGKRPVSEDDVGHNWLRRGGHYVRSRLQGEELGLSYARQHGVPVVALCVANTYGPGDFLPTPHGGFLRAAVKGRLPAYVRGAGGESVDVRDAADAFLRAAEYGRPGARYIISNEWLSTQAVLAIGAAHAGVPPPRWGIPVAAMSLAGLIGEGLAAVRRRDARLTRTTARLMHVMTPLDNSRALTELGWLPRPIEQTIRDATDFFLATSRGQPPTRSTE